MEKINEERVAKGQMGVPADIAKTRVEMSKGLGSEWRFVNRLIFICTIL